jgi:hypothetical protein
MADSDATDNAKTTVAVNVLRDKKGADAATAPFFHLPRELRDEVYDLVALSAHTTYYDITLEANKQPRKMAYVTKGGSQFEVEYAAAAERRIKSLLVAGDRSGLQLCSPDPRLHAWGQAQQVKAEDHWLEGSQGRRADGSYGQNIHAIILVVPLAPNANTHDLDRPSTVVFAFRFPGKEELGPRLRFDAYWHQKSRGLTFPSVNSSAVQELLRIAQQVVWTGSIREYMMWRRYVVSYVRREG